MQNRKSEIWVGLFLLVAILAGLFLCLRVANITAWHRAATWSLSAEFDNIGGLKPGSPVKIGGVVIGRVTSISLSDSTLTPKVTLAIDEQYLNKIPDSSSLAVRTQGLLGEQYLALNLGFSDPDLGTSMLKNGGTITDTKSAMVLEDLIGQFLYKSNDSKPSTNTAPENAASPPTSVAH
ncbi:outer membrane lipid asymmetry maintenance protein MlaD [Rosenbergiella australiborealis]|uniref:Outer membrane lipid asymmetry maintenance protein MlaD n=1 Tax=Rosenbergiella australiborealis TaxID=1544696 RepID=A0ABS5T0G7_9GAMM|nr:outer membrane lipid asymmetry maintenance protein MlaD [Rosenbergiella australiborealis]MBT0725839.1 outer membrane lipid asymmetry maintenance protein MlaD [Rosenbergiella australiborealis]